MAVTVYQTEASQCACSQKSAEGMCGFKFKVPSQWSDVDALIYVKSEGRVNEVLKNASRYA